MIVAAKMKAEGVRAGVPDLFLPVARQGFHGLWIELKSAKGRVTTVQAAWHERLRAQGYRVVVCRGWCEARDEIVKYLLQGPSYSRASLRHLAEGTPT